MRGFLVAVLVCLVGCSSQESGGKCAATNPQLPASCNECLQSNCCSELSACVEGTACNACANDVSCSDKGKADLDAFEACFSDHCLDACGLGSLEGTGGAAGSDGISGNGAIDAGGTSLETGGGPSAGTGGKPNMTPECADADAPGMQPADALALDATSDCDDTPLEHTGEVLAPADVDWFSYGVTDEALCAINASATATGGDMQLCAFGKLQNCDITCTTGTATARAGLKGCCASGTDPSLQWATGCGLGESASGTMFLEITSTTDACQPYTLSYGF